MPPDPDERPRDGGPYRVPAEPSDDLPEGESDWGGSVMLFVALAPWLVPLGQALRGNDTFGWSAAIGLVSGLAMVVGVVRTLTRRSTKKKDEE